MYLIHDRISNSCLTTALVILLAAFGAFQSSSTLPSHSYAWYVPHFSRYRWNPEDASHVHPVHARTPCTTTKLHSHTNFTQTQCLS